ARERAGYTAGDVALAVKKDVEVVESWESGASAPTYAQLEKLAYQLYKRPLALFFFPAPPEERDPAQEFRTLPDFEIERLSSDTRFALRQAAAMQLALKELNDGANPSHQKIFRDIPANPETAPGQLATSVREYLGVTLATQRSWKNTEEALQHWRALVEDKGVFVFKRSFKQRDVSGFCLVDKEFPVIYLNNSTAPSRQSFTLFHELAHILLETSGVTKQNDRYIDSLAGFAKGVEVFANRFAAEFLVPSEDFDQQLSSGPYDDQYVRQLADRYRVSREVVLRKLLDRHLVERAYYEAKAGEWAKQYQDSRGENAGGNYYATQATYLGDKYLQLTFSKYYQGRYGIEQLADYLNVKVKSIPGLEQFVLKRATA
ncbi:MAG: ImmA/IrrE family metallo-endopeptidase, partial [Acidobacteria bacterium]|nr:ImmA/IrrE family metallo-endopeptidase [Acidobacteriota bacterium]